MQCFAVPHSVRADQETVQQQPEPTLPLTQQRQGNDSRTNTFAPGARKIADQGPITDEGMPVATAKALEADTPESPDDGILSPILAGIAAVLVLAIGLMAVSVIYSAWRMRRDAKASTKNPD